MRRKRDAHGKVVDSRHRNLAESAVTMATEPSNKSEGTLQAEDSEVQVLLLHSGFWSYLL